MKRRRSKLKEIPSASMADIAFLLLVFFLVTTTISMDKGIGQLLPAIGEELEVNPKNITKVLVNATGQVLLDEELIPLNQLRGRIRTMLAQNDKLIVSVKTHPQTKHQIYIDVLDQLKQAGAPRISIAEPDL
ncbi:MAG: biopolymer transporter ExbD [Fidelibacterota bacterium]|jgi:biopolymer transport protein ExbD|nr:MAG: biopolymer transporter ExbD [Candidatus Neomarinimicrobiota bacterium]